MLYNDIFAIFELVIMKLKYKIMKMTFLNLRKLGLVLVAASTMAVVSCGPSAEEAEGTEVITEQIDMFAEEVVAEEVAEEVTEETIEESADAVVEEVHEHVEGDGHEH